MEEYLKKVLEQIRCKKAQGEIREELRAHIEDQKEANLAAGMSAEEAEREAVADMGDPVETGIALDKVCFSCSVPLRWCSDFRMSEARSGQAFRFLDLVLACFL